MNISRVEGEAGARPVAAEAEATHLLEDAPTVVAVPRVDPLLEAHPAERLLGGALIGELTLDDVLRGDGGVIGARAPFHLATAHAAVAREHVLHRLLHRVADGHCAGPV